jgi:hypothetical protein
MVRTRVVLDAASTFPYRWECKTAQKETTMKKAHAISIFCTLLILFMAGSALAQTCDRSDTSETGRMTTAQEILEADLGNYASRINHRAPDILHKDPFFTNTGHAEVLDYLDGFHSGSIYGWTDDRAVTVKDEVATTYPDGSMTYIATLQWTGTSTVGFYFQTGMAIMKFRPGEGCPYYHRDYWSEGDSWYQVPAWNREIALFRGIYINIMQLTGRCFDDDQDGYTKYAQATGCPNPGLDCNDFVPEINPGAIEIPGNGINDDCDKWTPEWGTPMSVVDAEYKESSDIANHLFLLCVPIGAVLLLRGLRRRK